MDDDSQSIPHNQDDDENQIDLFCDAFESSSSSSFIRQYHDSSLNPQNPLVYFLSPSAPCLRRRSFSHRFRDEMTATSGNGSDRKSSLSFDYDDIKDSKKRVVQKIEELVADNENSDFPSSNFVRNRVDTETKDDSVVVSEDSDANSYVGFDYTASKDRKKGFSDKIEELVGEIECLDPPGGQLGSNLVSNNADMEIKDGFAIISEDPETNSLVGFDYTASEEQKKRFSEKVEELVDENDDSKGFGINLNTEFKDDLGGCSRDNFDLPSGEISSNLVINGVNTETKDSEANPLAGFDYTASEERKKRFAKKLEELETTKWNSGLQTGNSLDEENRDGVAANCANDDDLVTKESSSDFLLSLAGLVIKVIGLQLSLLLTFVTFPLRFMYCAYMFVVDPFQVARRGTAYAKSRLFKIVSFVCEKSVSFAGEWSKEHRSIGELVLRFGWGFLWAAYVCIVLVSLLILAFVLSGVLVKKLVVEPVQKKESLTFDYTKNSPVAFVPITSCPVEPRGMSFAGKGDGGNAGFPRVIPRNHKLQATVSLMLPESDYNRNLGIFQVRVDLLSANGRSLASSKHPCMLHFKSQPIRMLMTFLRVAPLVTGYSSESQTLNVNLRGFTEGDIPTSCVRVIIEQRAEFRPGAGIPEIYDASLTFESQLPLLMKLMWLWKKTLFIWLGLSMFTMQLLFALVCCGPLILPRGRTRGGSAGNIAVQAHHAQR